MAKKLSDSFQFRGTTRSVNVLPNRGFGDPDEDETEDDIAHHLMYMFQFRQSLSVDLPTELGIPKISSGETSTTENESKQGKGYDYDLIVMGGGSGGIACAKEAGVYNKKVAVLDYVTPTPHGTKWGLGGTCVNVGCIPKKLMHASSLLREAITDSKSYGWEVPETIPFSWETMAKNVHVYIRSLNFGHRVQLNDNKIDYYNAKGFFVDNHTIRATDKKDKERVFTGEHIVIATGGRPKYPDIPGAREYCITSDDLFWLKKSPGKTLVVGASYVALECAGFLTGCELDTTVMIRSIPLRGFDQQMAGLIVAHMADHGTRVLQRCVPTKVEKEHCGRLKVTWQDVDGQYHHDKFDTVLFAVGRTPETHNIGLNNTDVKVDENTGEILCDQPGQDPDKSTADNIYAIGDIAKGRPELTPVAAKSGKLLTHRLFSPSKKAMDYNCVATAVFTPLEYGCIGLSEEDAIVKHGVNRIEVYHAYHRPLEFAIPGRNAEQCYIKVIAHKTPPHKILGFHYLGPNAGEITQGFSLAFKCGVTMEHLHNTVGIHPTVAEEIVKLHITKSSGEDPHITGC